MFKPTRPPSRALLFLLVLATLLLISACGGEPVEAPARPLVVGLSAEQDSLNVYLSNTSEALLIANRTLPRLGAEVLPDGLHEGGIHPELAESWELSEDGLTLTFHLSPGRQWADSSAIACEDVVFTLAAQTAPEVGWRAASIKRHIRSVSCPDPLTAVFHFDKSYPGQVMDANDLHILPRSLARIPFDQWRRTDWQKALTSGGPYKVASVRAGQEVVLERAEEWGGRSGPARIERIVLRIVPDSSSRVTQLLAGDLDLVDRLTPEEATRLAGAKDLEIVRRPGFRYTYIGFNTLDPAAYLEYRRHREGDCRREELESCADAPETIAEISRSNPHALFGNARIRRAITQAIDRSALVDSLLLGEGEIPSSPFLAPLDEHDPSLEPWPYDPQAAAGLFRAAGFTERGDDDILKRGGQRFSFRLFVQSGNAQRMQAATLIQQQLRSSGVEVKIEPVENSSFYARISNHDTDAWIGGWRTSLRVDATENLHEQSCGTGGVNFGCWTHPRGDQLASLAREIVDQNQRVTAWRRWERIFHQQQPYTILFRPNLLTAVHTRVRGASESILSGDPLAGVENWTIETPAR